MIFLHAGKSQTCFESRDSAQSNEKVFICESPVMKGIYDKIRDLAYSSESVLILGSEGTGRSTVSRQIFDENKSHSFKRQFIEFKLQGYSSHLIHKRLFGDQGLLSSGADNTLFLSGIELLNQSLQKKLLSYLLDQNNKKALPRLICSSNENLPKRVKDGYFFQALFNFLSESLIILPLLHERPEDVPVFIKHFNKGNDFKGRLNYSALEFLKSYRSYSNISELKKICLQISILYSDKSIVTEKDLSYVIQDNSAGENLNIEYNPNISLEALSNLYIQKSLDYFKCKKMSAKALGISVKTIYNKIKTGDIQAIV